MRESSRSASRSIIVPVPRDVFNSEKHFGIKKIDRKVTIKDLSDEEKK